MDPKKVNIKECRLAVSRRFCHLSRYFVVYLWSIKLQYFAVYSSSITLFYARKICVIIGLAGRCKTSTPHAASRIPIVPSTAVIEDRYGALL
jgi:hypothetical protein